MSVARVRALLELAGMELEAYQLAEFTGSKYTTWFAQRAKYRLDRIDELLMAAGPGDKDKR